MYEKGKKYTNYKRTGNECRKLNKTDKQTNYFNFARDDKTQFGFTNKSSMIK